MKNYENVFFIQEGIMMIPASDNNRETQTKKASEHLTAINEFIVENKALDANIYEVNDTRDKNYQPYHKKTSYQDALKLRAENYKNAALFLLDQVDHIEQDEKTNIIDNINKKYEAFCLSSEEKTKKKLSEYVTELSNCFAPYNSKLSKAIGFKDLIFAENLLNWQRKRKVVVTINKFKHPTEAEKEPHTLVQFDVPQIKLTESQKDEFKRCNSDDKPLWFQSLPSWERSYWGKLISDLDGDISSELGCMPSTLRHYPGLANFMVHGVAIYKEGKRTFHLMRKRSSIIYPIEIEDKEEADRIAVENIKQLVESYEPDNSINPINLLLQTLVSPLTHLPIPEGYERVMLEEKKKAAKKYAKENTNINVIETNHPFSKVSLDIKVRDVKLSRGLKVRGVFYKNEDYSGAIKNILRMVNEYFNQLPKGELKTHLQSSVTKLQDQIDQSKLSEKLDDFPEPWLVFEKLNSQEVDSELVMGTAIILYCCRAYIELHFLENKKDFLHVKLISALEEIIVALCPSSIAHASCKSGKDRRAVLLMLEDTMCLFFHFFRKMDIKNDNSSNMKNYFADIFVSLFESGHHQMLAEYNACGCFGLKSVEKALPDFIFEKIHEDLLKHNELCSDLNRLDYSSASYRQRRELCRKGKEIKENFENGTYNQEKASVELRQLLNEPTLIDEKLRESFTNDLNEVMKFTEEKPHYSMHQLFAGFFTVGNPQVNSVAKNGNTTFNFKFSSKVYSFSISTNTNCNINEKNEEGRTLFHLGCMYGNTELVKILLQFPNINIWAKDKDHKTAHNLASEYGQKKIVKIIKDETKCRNSFI